MLELYIHQVLLHIEPDVGLHIESAIVVHDIEDDCLGWQCIIFSELQDDNGLGIRLWDKRSVIFEKDHK